MGANDISVVSSRRFARTSGMSYGLPCFVTLPTVRTRISNSSLVSSHDLFYFLASKNAPFLNICEILTVVKFSGVVTVARMVCLRKNFDQDLYLVK